MITWLMNRASSLWDRWSSTSLNLLVSPSPSLPIRGNCHFNTVLISLLLFLKVLPHVYASLKYILFGFVCFSSVCNRIMLNAFLLWLSLLPPVVFKISPLLSVNLWIINLRSCVIVINWLYQVRWSRLPSWKFGSCQVFCYCGQPCFNCSYTCVREARAESFSGREIPES